ncbi:hypothetical protein Tco_0027976 [Tanacetum coccineum]
MSTPVNTSSTDSQMHNNIMAAGSKDRPPMLGPGRYSQWRSRFLRYIDTKPNGEGLRKSILSGPYVPSTVLVQAIPYDTSDLANRFAPNREETMTLANKSRSKLKKDYVKPSDTNCRIPYITSTTAFSRVEKILIYPDTLSDVRDI